MRNFLARSEWPPTNIHMIKVTAGICICCSPVRAIAATWQSVSSVFSCCVEFFAKRDSVVKK